MNKTERFKELYVKHNTDTVKNFEYHFNQQFKGIDFTNKKILEIGCGKGFLSLYIACFMNPLEIISLDEAEGEGSEKDVLDLLSDNINLLGLTNLMIVKSDILNYHNYSYFDIIISNNALHHVCEHGLLKHDIRARQKYIKIFQHLYNLNKPNSTLTIFEYSRNSVWRYLPNNKFKDIEWSLHPTKTEWINVIKSAGYKIKVTKFAIPFKLRKFPFLINALSLYFYFPSFYIIANTSS
jgi:SAM-dependent methyltransferase